MSRKLFGIALFGLIVLSAIVSPARADILTLWNFNFPATGDSNVLTGTWQPAIGSGSFTNIGGTTNFFNTPANGGANATSDFQIDDNSALRLGQFPAVATANKTAGIQFFASTAGFSNIVVTWDQENSATASRYWRAQYSIDAGAHWIDFTVIQTPGSVVWTNQRVADFSAVLSTANNPNFGFRLVSEFQSTAASAGPPAYIANTNGSSYSVNGTLWVDMVTLSGIPLASAPVSVPPTFSVLTYNVAGGNFDDTPDTWSVTNARIHAIGAELNCLRPDIVAFEEYSVSNTWQVTNFINAFLPGYFVATNSTIAGGPRNVIFSRFPIARSTSWLARSDLNPFGFDGDFTRDLFEAEIKVPGFPMSLHVFDVHLKAFDDSTNAVRRGAEARSISNWLATVYLTGAYQHDPYLLMGDMNEDVFRPRPFEQDAIGALTSVPTGLNLSSPINPVTRSELTFNSTNATIRFDYILTSSLLFSNYVTGQVFRTDQTNANHPLPPGVSFDSTEIASDHLPVIQTFNNPFAPFAIRGITSNGSNVTLNWDAQISATYRVESSSNFSNWTIQASNLVANTTNDSWTGSRAGAVRFYRIVRGQ